MSELVTWLRAQLDRDAGVARTAFADHNQATANWLEIWSGAVLIGQEEDLVITNDSGVSRHMVNWDPARALAEVESKRRILLEHPRGDDGFCGDGIGLVGCKWAWPCPTVRLVALPYAGRPGYREEWRP
jgi:hypothetical protein